MHIYGPGALSSYPISCQGCHKIPASVYETGHLSSPTDGVIMSDPLTNAGHSGSLAAASYDPVALQCSNTYCHGTWRLAKSGAASDSVYDNTGVMLGNTTNAPHWNGGVSDKTCGSCHALPPVGHKSYSQNCAFCHGDVTNASNQISNKAKHMNGKIDLVGGSTPFR
jgi:predicted CxxxxCH...CXXCH cytochrome family protein